MPPEERSKIQSMQAMVADGKSFKAAIAVGLKLSTKGEARVQVELSKPQTDKWISDNDEHLWNHNDTTKKDHKFAYAPKPPEVTKPAGADGGHQPEVH